MRTSFGFYVAVLLSLSSDAHAQSLTDDIKAKAQRLAAPLVETRDSRLQSVATFDHQVTGVTVAPDGRIFVNFPRWTEDSPVSVAELMPDGSIKPGSYGTEAISRSASHGAPEFFETSTQENTCVGTTSRCVTTEL